MNPTPLKAAIGALLAFAGVTLQAQTHQRYGNTTYGSDGTTYQRHGNQTFIQGPDGRSTSCRHMGNTTFCD